MKTRLALLVSFLFTAVLAHAASDYAIQLTRKITVGDHYRVTATGSDEQAANATVDGQPMPPRGESLAVELVADCEVLAVSPAGREAKARLVIVKFVRLAAGQPVDLLPAGTIVDAEKTGDKTIFTVGDTKVAGPVAKAFETAGIGMFGDDTATDDTVFGTTERKKVGDSWAINAAAAAADLAKKKIPATADKLNGEVKLVEVVQQDNQPVLRISATVAMHGVNPPMPPGMEVQSSEFTSSHSGLFPADPTKLIQQESSTMNMALTASGTQNGRTMSMSVTQKRASDKKFTRN